MDSNPVILSQPSEAGVTTIPISQKRQRENREVKLSAQSFTAGNCWSWDRHSGRHNVALVLK